MGKLTHTSTGDQRRSRPRGRQRNARRAVRPGKLHPTPAVSGLPKTESITLINQIENHELGYSRSLYSGYLGHLGEQTSQLYVNIRCCQLFPNAAYLYIGGGYTEDSSPIDEWKETESKGETLISIMEKL